MIINWRIRFWLSQTLEYLSPADPTNRFVNGRIVTAQDLGPQGIAVFDEFYNDYTHKTHDNWYFLALRLLYLMEYNPLQMAPIVVEFSQSDSTTDLKAKRSCLKRMIGFYSKIESFPLKDATEKETIEYTVEKLKYSLKHILTDAREL